MELTLKGERVTCTRRPTHGEFDVGEAQRLLMVVAFYQGVIAHEDENPREGSSLKIARALFLVEDALGAVAQSTRRALRAILPADKVGLIDESDPQDMVSTSMELIAALGQNEHTLPKS